MKSCTSFCGREAGGFDGYGISVVEAFNGAKGQKCENLWSTSGITIRILKRTVDTHVRRAGKLGPHAGMIETVRGVGYRAVEV